MTFLQKLILFNDIAIFSRLNRFWSRLHDIELACFSIFGPLEIHRGPSSILLAVMVFDVDRPFGELQNFFIVEAKFLPAPLAGVIDFLSGLLPFFA